MGKAFSGNTFYALLLVSSGIAFFFFSNEEFHYWLVLVPLLARLGSTATTVSIREHLQWRRIKNMPKKTEENYST
jgi:hypothetical protein